MSAVAGVLARRCAEGAAAWTLPPQRRAHLRAHLARGEPLDVDALGRELGVTGRTVRRDLRLLAAERGPAGAPEAVPAVGDDGGAPGGVTAGLRAGTRVGLCAGAGAADVARGLGGVPGLVVVTNSLSAAAVLARAPAAVTTVLTPGVLDGDELTGDLMAAAVAGARLDVALITAPSPHAAAQGCAPQRAFAAASARVRALSPRVPALG